MIAGCPKELYYVFFENAGRVMEGYNHRRDRKTSILEKINISSLHSLK